MKFDSVIFTNEATRRHIQSPSPITDITFCPTPGDHVRFARIEGVFLVTRREFKYTDGETCTLFVFVVPAEEKLILDDIQNES